jgi:hypothetical protein
VFPRVTTPPLARDVTHDGKSDLVFSNFRVGLLPGNSARQLIPASFSSYVVANSAIRLVTARDDQVGGATPLVAITALDGVEGLYAPDLTNGGLLLRAELPRPLRDLVGAPISADLFPGRDSPCAEVIVAYRGASSFKVYDMCEVGSESSILTEVIWRDVPREQTVRLPDGLRIDAAPLVADMNGDGHLDVLIGANQHPYLVPNDGQALAALATDLQIEFLGSDGPVLLTSPDILMPLAVGDFSNDGVADLVTPELLFTSRVLASRAQYFPSYQNRGQAWTMAEIADLNGNGFKDVLAASAGSPGLSFFNGTGGRYEVQTTLPTQGPVSFLTTGDFDGDLVRDVAFLEGPSSSNTQSLAVAFGRRDSPPLQATHIANLSGVEQLGQFPEFGVDALFAASRTRASGVDFAKVTLFDGSPDRLPLAPYSLVTFSTNGLLQDSLALSVVVGSFSRPGSNDVLALGTQDLDDNWSLWLLPNIGEAQEPPRQLQAEIPQGLRPVDFAKAKTLGVVGVAADVDGDGIDESVWLASRGSEGCALLVYQIDAQQISATLRQRLDLAEPCPAPQLAAWDVDRDGANVDAFNSGVDLLALTGDASAQPRRLSIFWNDRAGGFSSQDRSFVSDASGADVRAFSAFREFPQVAFVTENKLYTARTLENARELNVVEAIAAEFRDLRSVVVTDPSGDGIEDLAVADAEGLWLIPAKLR